MGTLLIHLSRGPEDPTRATLAFLVAKAAQEEGHQVTVFLAGDSVQLLRDSVLDQLTGLGTGNLRESYDAVVSGGATLYASGLSAKARGVELEGRAEAAMPNRLVQLVFEHDRVLSY